MTNEEAIRCIQVWRACRYCSNTCYDEKTNTLCELYHDMDRLDFDEALDKAIEELKKLDRFEGEEEEGEDHADN